MLNENSIPILTRIVWVWPKPWVLRTDVFSGNPYTQDRTLIPPSDHRTSLRPEWPGLGESVVSNHPEVFTRLLEQLAYQKPLVFKDLRYPPSQEDASTIFLDSKTRVACELITDSLEFHFSDNTFATIKEVLFIENSKKDLLQDILPSTSTSKRYSWSYDKNNPAFILFKDAFCSQADYFPDYKEEWVVYHMLSFLFETIYNLGAQLRKKHKSGDERKRKFGIKNPIIIPEFYLAFSNQKNISRESFEIRGFCKTPLKQQDEFLHIDAVIDPVKGQGLQLSVAHENHPHLLICCNGLAYQADTKQLYFHNSKNFYFHFVEKNIEIFQEKNILSNKIASLKAFIKFFLSNNSYRLWNEAEQDFDFLEPSRRSPLGLQGMYQLQQHIFDMEGVAAILKGVFLNRDQYNRPWSADLRQVLGKIGVLPSVFQENQTTTKQSFLAIEPNIWKRKFHVYLNNSSDFCLQTQFISEGMATLHFETWNFSTRFGNIFKWCESGFEGLPGQIPYSYSWHDSLIMRKMFSRIQRNQGVMLFSLLEYCNFILGRPMSAGAEIKDWPSWKNYIYDQIELILIRSKPGVKETSDDQIKQAFSKYRKQLFENLDLLNNCINRLKLEIITPLGFCEFPENHRENLALIRIFIQGLVVSTDGQIFLKERTQLFEEFLQQIFRSSGLSASSTSAKTFNFPEVFKKNFFHLTLFELMDFGFELSINQSKVENATESDIQTTIEINQQGSQDYFELNPKVFFKGEKIDFTDSTFELNGNIIEFQGQFYRIPKSQIPRLKTLERFWKKILTKPTKRSFSLSIENQIYKLPKSQVLEMLKLRESKIEVQGDAEWDRICAFFDTLGHTARPGISNQLSSSLNKVLKPYQLQGVQWLLDLYTLKLGGILADDMGLGKTVQTLSFMSLVRQKKESQLANLIVVPSSLVYNWISESEKFTPDLPIQRWGCASKTDLALWFKEQDFATLVISYGILLEHSDFFVQQKWNIVIFDEAQNLKNITAARTTMARQMNARFKLTLSGTPFENNLKELYSLVDLVLPGALGDISPFIRQFDDTKVNLEDITFLKQLIKPIVLRRQKNQVLQELPDKTIHLLKLDFSKKQKEIYKKVAGSQSQQIARLVQEQGELKSRLQMFTALTRLRQICSDPACLPNVSYEEIPPKVELLIDSVKEHIEKGESVIVFTQFLTTQNRISTELTRHGIFHQNMNGSTTQNKRVQILSDFETSEEPSVLVMTLKTGGVGLNLTKASVVIHLEPWWNPAVENQATDRVHRMGQNRDVSVYRYIMKDSLEEKMEILKTKKEKTFNLVFDDTESVDAESILLNNKGLSHEDFHFLIQ